MRELFTTLGEIVAAMMIATGFHMYAPPLGWIVGGVELAGLCWLAAR